MNNWPKAAMASKAFHDTSAGKVAGVMFMDRDYKPDELFAEVISSAKKDALFITVWQKKEIENFFLDPVLMHSYIENRARESVNYEDVDNIFKEVMDEMGESLPELIADLYQKHDRSLALQTAMSKAKAFIESRFKEGAEIRDLVCGKRAISLLSARSQDLWSTQLSPMSLCRHLKLGDTPPELVKAISNLVDFAC